MTRNGRPKAVLELTEEEREQLQRRSRRRKSSQALALLQRSDHRSVQALEADIRAWIKAWNEDPKPFIWTKTADQILGTLGRLLKRITDAGH